MYKEIGVGSRGYDTSRDVACVVVDIKEAEGDREYLVEYRDGSLNWLRFDSLVVYVNEKTP